MGRGGDGSDGGRKVGWMIKKVMLRRWIKVQVVIEE